MTYVDEIRTTEYKIIWLREKAEALRSCLLPDAIRYDLDKVQTSPEDRTAGIMAEVQDLEAEIRRLTLYKADLIRRLSEAIEQVPDDRERYVLTAYYIGGRSMAEIASTLGLSIRQAYRVCTSGEKFINCTNVIDVT